jgi:hypothetical protein
MLSIWLKVTFGSGESRIELLVVLEQRNSSPMDMDEAVCESFSPVLSIPSWSIVISKMLEDIF